MSKEKFSNDDKKKTYLNLQGRDLELNTHQIQELINLFDLALSMTWFSFAVYKPGLKQIKFTFGSNFSYFDLTAEMVQYIEKNYYPKDEYIDNEMFGVE